MSGKWRKPDILARFDRLGSESRPDRRASFSRAPDPKRQANCAMESSEELPACTPWGCLCSLFWFLCSTLKPKHVSERIGWYISSILLELRAHSL